MRIGVIASMKKGLEQFVYRELLVFSEQNISIELFPTKYGEGLYQKHQDWILHTWTAFSVLMLQPFCFLTAPLRYLRLLWEAITTAALVDFAVAWYFARRMSEVDVIYSTFGDHKFFIGYFCKRITNKPLVVTVHAYELYRNPNPALFKRALNACDQIIAPTEYNRELLTRVFGAEPRKIEVVRYSIDTRDYHPAKNFVILIVGFFVERKGHEVLFRALRQLPQQDIEVWVVGDEGAERESVDVRAMAAKLGVQSKVAFFGKLSGNALKAVYRSCDVFCLPCRTDSQGVAEGFPNVLIEAMACGKPVISTRHVEIPRIVKEILVDENDVDGLARAICAAYSSAVLRQDLGERNRKLVEQLFSTNNATRTAAIFQELAGLSDRPAASDTNAVYQAISTKRPLPGAPRN